VRTGNDVSPPVTVGTTYCTTLLSVPIIPAPITRTPIIFRKFLLFHPVVFLMVSDSSPHDTWTEPSIHPAVDMAPSQPDEPEPHADSHCHVNVPVLFRKNVPISVSPATTGMFSKTAVPLSMVNV